MGLTQLWYPDTCRNGQCIIEVTKDWVTGEVIQTCVHHAAQGHATGQALFAAALATNRAKNFGTAEAAAEMGVEHAAVPWGIGADDLVTVTSGLNASRRARLQNAINARVGIGKVVVT